MRISDWSSDVCSSDLLTIRYDTLFLLLSVNGRFAKPFCPRGKEGQPAAQCNWLKGVGIPTGIDTQGNKNMKVADRRKQPPREKAPPLRLVPGEWQRNAVTCRILRKAGYDIHEERAERTEKRRRGKR